MALKLIRRGPETVRVRPGAGVGWQHVELDGSKYLFAGAGWCQVTVTGVRCSGVRIENANYSNPRPAQSGESTASMVCDLTGKRTVMVLVRDATEETEVTMSVVPIPPPYSIAGFLRRLVGGCRGADKNRPDTGGLRQRLVCTQGRRTGGAANSWAGLVRQGITARGVFPSGADVCAGVGTVNHVGVHTSRRSDLYGGTDRAGLHRQGVRNRHLPHHLAPQGVSC